MELGFDLPTLLTGLLIFVTRVVDVSLGTVRTISTVQGRTKTAFFLGFIEVSMWLVVISAVVNTISHKPVLGVFYALGFSTGNVVGILMEKRLAFGHIVLRIISSQMGREMAGTLRQSGFGVTTFQGEGLNGSVTELFVVSRRRDLQNLLDIATAVDPAAFYMTEQACSVNRIYRPCLQEQTGWRSIFKKK
jgi:uncharacterized protein YebE (UPF0316 family)